MQRVSRTSAQLWSFELHQAEVAGVRLTDLDALGRKVDAYRGVGALRRLGGLAEHELGALAAVLEHLRLQPAEHVLAPGAHVGGLGLDQFAAVRADRHDVPEADVAVGGRADGVVQIGQTEVVPVLVGDHADPGVLGLSGVVEDPDAAGLRDGARHRWRRRRRCSTTIPRTSPARLRRPPGRYRHAARSRGPERRQARRGCRRRRSRPGPRRRTAPRGSPGSAAASALTASMAICPVPSGLVGWPMSLDSPASQVSAE